jgi:transposase
MSDTELLHEPKTAPVRRVEVFTGAGRRRAWTAAEKARIVAESHGGRGSVSAVARRRGLTPQQLFGWRRQACRPESEGGALENSVAFAPVIVAGAGCAEQPQPCSLPEAPTIEIVIGATTVRVRSGADLPTLRAVLRAVRTVS